LGSKDAQKHQWPPRCLGEDSDRSVIDARNGKVRLANISDSLIQGDRFWDFQPTKTQKKRQQRERSAAKAVFISEVSIPSLTARSA